MAAHQIWPSVRTLRDRVILILLVCSGFAGFAQTAQAASHSEIAATAKTPANHADRTPDCDRRPDSGWYTIQIFDYAPFPKGSYSVLWEICHGEDFDLQRVRLMDDDLKKTFLKYEDSEVLRLEQVDLLSDQHPELLVITTNPGTGDDEDWHVVGEYKGKLHQWKPPNYDSASEKLLGKDENFCCKDWNFHLWGNEIFLARGIYREGDGNCCPSRGGVLVELKPIENGFRMAKIERISKSAYHDWAWQPFCIQCTLYKP